MGKYFVSRKSYDVLLDRVTFLEELLDKRFSISVPYITIDGATEAKQTLRAYMRHLERRGEL